MQVGLEEFLTASPAAAASLSLLEGFPDAHTEADCLGIIEDQACGGDGGVTRDCVRAACGLAQMSAGFQNQVLAQNYEYPATRVAKKLQSASDALITACLDSGVPVTKSSVLGPAFREAVKGIARKDLLGDLSKMGL